MLAELISGPGTAEIPRIRLARLESWITLPAEVENGFAEIKPCLFVRMTATDGTSGWGEAYVLPCREEAVALMIHQLGRELASLEKVDPWHLRDLATRLSIRHHSIDFAAATSALDMALWDLMGRLVDRPVVELLGGRSRQGVPVYANIWSETNWSGTALATRAANLVAQGYEAIKIHPMLNHDAAQAAAAVHRVRASIGDGCKLMVDMDSETDPSVSIAVADGIRGASPYWFEEPADGADIAALAMLRRETGLPIVTGERQSGAAHFRSVLASGAADIFNPDIAGVGGLLDMLEIALAADRLGVRMSPHCWNSMTVAATAMIHLCATIPNAEIAEIYPEYIEHGARYAEAGFTVATSLATLTERPGLGVVMDDVALAALSGNRQETELATAGPRR
jgi:galactonate dehydratase